MKPHVAIIGGGITGLTAAFTLLQQGCGATVFEGRPSIGGLSATHDFGAFHWDRFYHCILTSDDSLLQLIDDLDLSSSMRWRSTEVGFYFHRQLRRFTTPADLLRLPGLPLSAKIRFGLGVLYAGRICRGKGLDAMPLKEWTVRVFGETVFREIWDPLLRCKLGDMRSEASASFLWSTIRRLYSTRGKGAEKKEMLGYVEGGYRAVLDRLAQAVTNLGGKIRIGCKLDRIEPTAEGVGVASSGGFREYDAGLMTMPAPAIMRMVPSLSEEYKARLRMPAYLGMVCIALVLRRPVSSFYLTNIAEDVPFTGVVEMTNLIDAGRNTNGYSLLYLPKYTASADPLFLAGEDEVWDRFSPAFWRMFPTLRPSDIVSRHCFREPYVQPVPTLNYSDRAPTVETGIPHLFVANTTQIVNDTLNNNAMVRIARNACSVVLRDLSQPRYRDVERELPISGAASV